LFEKELNWKVFKNVIISDLSSRINMAVWRKLIITFGKMYDSRAPRPIGNDVAMEKEMLGDQ